MSYEIKCMQCFFLSGECVKHSEDNAEMFELFLLRIYNPDIYNVQSIVYQYLNRVQCYIKVSF